MGVPPMSVRSSDIMALTAILAGAGAGYGLTNLYAHSQQEEAPVVAESITVVESAGPRTEVEVEPFRVEVRARPTVVVTTAPHVITRMRMGPRVMMFREMRHDARAGAREARERAREVRKTVRVGEAFALQEALYLEALEALESLDALESLGDLENVVDLEALEQALEGLEEELDGVLTIDVEVLDDADDQRKRKKRKKRRIIVKRPGGSGG